MSSSNSSVVNGDDDGECPHWEVRPGGMLVQKRDPDEDAAHSGPLLRLKVSYSRSSRYVSIKAHSTFGDLKKALVADTGLQPEQQRLLYKGKEKKDRDSLSEAGLKDKSKLVLVKDETGWEKKLIELRKTEAIANASKAVAEVQVLVDKLSGQIASVESAVRSGKKLPDSEIVGLSDLLMCQLVKLEESKVEGDVKVRKKILIRRVQKYVENLDDLKVRNDKLHVAQTVDPRRHQSGSERSRPDTRNAPKSMRTHPSGAKDTVVTTSWETFGTSSGNFNAKPPGLVPESRRTSTGNLSMKPIGSIPESRRASTGNINTKPAVPIPEPLLIQWD